MLAFVLGLLSRAAGLPPLVGFLSAGFLMNAQSIEGGEMLEKLSDLGIALLFFVVGLELNLGAKVDRRLWHGASSLHCSALRSLDWHYWVFPIVAGPGLGIFSNRICD